MGHIIGKLNIDPGLISNDLITVNTFPMIEEEYTEFGTGYWKNNSLLNESGDFHNTKYNIYTSAGKKTELWHKVPYITELIENTFDTTYLKMVRTRNLIDGLVIPHKDFVELGKDKDNYLRIFIPLENNINSYHSDEESVFQMKMVVLICKGKL